MVVGGVCFCGASALLSYYDNVVPLVMAACLDCWIGLDRSIDICLGGSLLHWLKRMKMAYLVASKTTSPSLRIRVCEDDDQARCESAISATSTS
mmetsp:Transcript_26812/g.62421  ORF Transcript_26812/g.62421 Transcript_26812/m.62421 type:complete len:94 (+) Transcript_26812:23-304(+)